jgi:hypothetical protein
LEVSGGVSPAARIVQTCASVLEEGITALIDIGEDERAERCKRALVALVGEDFGDEYAYLLMVQAIEMSGRSLDDYERHNEMAKEFAKDIASVDDVGDFLDACGDE